MFFPPGPIRAPIKAGLKPVHCLKKQQGLRERSVPLWLRGWGPRPLDVGLGEREVRVAAAVREGLEEVRRGGHACGGLALRKQDVA